MLAFLCRLSVRSLCVLRLPCCAIAFPLLPQSRLCACIAVHNCDGDRPQHGVIRGRSPSTSERLQVRERKSRISPKWGVVTIWNTTADPIGDERPRGMPSSAQWVPEQAFDVRPRRPLVITGSEQLLDDLLRIAAATGTELDVAPDLVAARDRWTDAPLIILDAAQVTDQVARSLPRRPAVVLVVQGEPAMDAWQRAVVVGAEHIAALPTAEPWLSEQLADVLEGPPRAVSVAITGVVGGCGATTLAAGLATVAGRHGIRTALVDADPWGGGIDLLFGGEGARGLRWADLTGAEGRLPAGALRDQLPRLDDLVVLSHSPSRFTAMSEPVVPQVIGALSRCNDLLVFDLPRYECGQASAAAPAPPRSFPDSEVTLAVVPDDVRGIAAARAFLPRLGGRVWVVTRRRTAALSGPEIAGLLGVPWLGEVRHEARLVAAAQRGEAPGASGMGALARLCAHLLQRIAAAVVTTRPGPLAARWQAVAQ